MTLNYSALATKYADGFSDIDLDDFDGATHADMLKFRADVTGTDVLYAGSIGLLRADHDGDDGDEGKPKKKARTFRYVMSTENPVGYFGDVVRVKGWDLAEFRRRGGPFLFAHNLDDQRHPLGSMSNLLKGDPGDFVRTKPTLSGDATFTAPGLNLFNDLTHDMVASGSMPGGSVGFRARDSRGPTDDELSEDKLLQKWSAIITKATLTEFSSVPIGMDPDALKKRGENGVDSLEAQLILAIESGKYDEDLLAEWRHAFLGEQLADASTRTVVPVAGVDDLTDEDLSQVVDDGTEQGTGDTNDAARASEAAGESAPSLSVEDTLRALHVLGLDTTEEELRSTIDRIRAMPEASREAEFEFVAELRAENEALRTIASEQATDIESLQERLSLLEGVLLPESASIDDGDGGNPEGEVLDIYEYVANLEGEALVEYVNAN